MNREVSRLSEHFRAVALSQLPLEQALRAHQEAIGRFGPVRQHRLNTWNEAFDWLAPLHTFPRHYVLADFGGWTLVVCDMIGESCMADVLFHSSTTGCEAVGCVALPNERSFFFIQHGKVVREVESFCEDHWSFRELGRPLSVERSEFYRRKKRSERLPEGLVFQYVSSITGIAFPLDFQTQPARLIAFERSWAALQVTPEDVRVENDLGTGQLA
jgi:hypothetical protein